MNFTKAIRRISVVVAISSVVLKPCDDTIAAERRTPNGLQVLDVELAEGGQLYGRVVRSDGSGIPHQPVSVLVVGHQASTTATATDGSFSFHGLRGGFYALQLDGSTTPCRLWTQGSAPPTAQQPLLLIRHDPLVRAQGNNGSGLAPIVGVATIVGIAWGFYELGYDDAPGSS